jgi:hypothetical protein
MADGLFDQATSERLFSDLSYAVFVAPGGIVVIWMVWRVMAWSLFHTAVVTAWVGHLPTVFSLPMAVGLLLIAWPLLLLALVAWILIRLFPGLAVEQGQAPRLFARNTSPALSHVFLFCVALPLVFVPMRYLADRLEGPKILFWHWLLVLGPIAVLVIWLIARLRQKQDWRSRL